MEFAEKNARTTGNFQGKTITYNRNLQGMSKIYSKRIYFLENIFGYRNFLGNWLVGRKKIEYREFSKRTFDHREYLSLTLDLWKFS